MFRCEAVVKHTLLESERPIYLGTDDGMINVELMTKLYMVITHNLNEARKARDGNRKNKTTKEPEKLKVGDNVLVRDHTSKAFQPNYKDFCIVGLLGKNQIEIKDNHGHITKVHRRDVKKIPMMEKICQLYKEGHTGKIREGRKAVPNSKMPDLGWDIAETQLPEEIRETSDSSPSRTTTLPQKMITIAILIIASLTSCIQKTLEIVKNMTQSVKSTISGIGCNSYIQNFKKHYQTAALAITIATNTTNHTNWDHRQRTTRKQHKQYGFTNTI